MIAIRQAKKEDISVLYKLGAGARLTPPSGYFERCLDTRQVFIVKTDKEAGYGLLNWHPRYALYKRLGIPEIQDINIIPSARRQGVATALINHCEMLAGEKGCAHIGISVGLYKEYGAAQRLYVKQGYFPDGYGVTYDRETVGAGEIHPVDDDLCLMMIKAL